MEVFQIMIRNISKAELSIIACIIGMVLFMRYDQKQKDSTGHKFIGLSLGAGFILLVLYRIYKGL